MSRVRCVAVIGLGLMGGSVARALSARGVRVVGFDTDPAALDRALGEGVIARILSADLSEVAEADVVVIGTPVDSVMRILSQIRDHAASALLVMDLASTKESVVTHAESAGFGERFVGAHPLTGSHRSGWEASRGDLFANAEVFLAPTKSTMRETLLLAQEFWGDLDAHTTVMSAREHDDQMAWRSHLPHVVSCAIACTLNAANVRRSALGPGGRDVTRLAGSSPSLWTSIAADNRAALLHALDGFQLQLDAFRAALVSGTELEVAFAESTQWFNRD